MVRGQDVTVNLSRLLRNDPHSDAEVEARGQFTPDVGLYEDDFELNSPLEYHLVISAVGDDDFLLQGTVSGHVQMACRRCLKPIEVGWESELIYSMEFAPGTDELQLRLDEDDDEVLMFGLPEVDFAVLLTEVFTVDRPITVAHPEGDPDCEDLAVMYGQDQDTAVDGGSPFASLKDLDLGSTEE